MGECEEEPHTRLSLSSAGKAGREQESTQKGRTAHGTYLIHSVMLPNLLASPRLCFHISGEDQKGPNCPQVQSTFQTRSRMWV